MNRLRRLRWSLPRFAGGTIRAWRDVVAGDPAAKHHPLGDTPMPRLVRTICLFGVLGLLATITVAWLSAATVSLWSDIWIQRHGVSADTYPCWGLVTIEKPSATYIFRSAISRPHGVGVDWLYRPGIKVCGPGLIEPPLWSGARQAPSGEPLDTYEGYAEDGRGWPFICLASTIDAALHPLDPGRGSGWTYGAVSWGITLPSTQGGAMPRSLPLRPVWIGILVNTIFYGLVIWLVVHGPVAIRGWYRVRFGRCGRCGRCGYPAGSSPRCSECGAPIEGVRDRGDAQSQVGEAMILRSRLMRTTWACAWAVLGFAVLAALLEYLMASSGVVTFGYAEWRPITPAETGIQTLLAALVSVPFALMYTFMLAWVAIATAAAIHMIPPRISLVIAFPIGAAAAVVLSVLHSTFLGNSEPFGLPLYLPSAILAASILTIAANHRAFESCRLTTHCAV